MDATKLLETGAAALLLAAMFLDGWRLKPVRRIIRDHRGIVSFGAGMSAAYVFVRVMPELHAARSVFAESVETPLWFDGMGIYLLGLIGFLCFYGLDHLHLRPGSGKESEETEGTRFKVHIGGFAVYVAVTGYLLVHHLENTRVSTIQFAVAIAFHFMVVDHGLRTEYGDRYHTKGRYLLAVMAIVGWGIGVLYALPEHIVPLLVAFISGAIVVNSMVLELPSEHNGRLRPFLIGGLLYGVILLPLS